jgi:nucleotidyltransferase/DNA polymerase involved in DNA repair
MGGIGTRVVSTANYKAREYGIHSAIQISQAWRLSEAAKRRGDHQAVFVHPDFNRYMDSYRPLPIGKIPGIDPKTEACFLGLGIKVVQDLRRFSQEELQLGNRKLVSWIMPLCTLQ